MVRNAVRRLPRMTVLATLALALPLAACGRKGPLDPPPASLASPAYAPGAQPAPGPDGQLVGPDGRPVAAPGAKKRLPVDWLLD